jgi:hypothetical protein
MTQGLEVLLRSKVSVLTGGPGVGKTMLLKMLVAMLVDWCAVVECWSDANLLNTLSSILCCDHKMFWQPI